MSALTCCVPNCNKTRKDNVILHVFPKPNLEPDRFRSWIYAIGGDLLALDNQYIHKNRRVCHIHFEERFHTRSRMLSANSVPSLHLSDLIRQRRVPFTDLSNENIPTQNQLEDVERAPQLIGATQQLPTTTPQLSSTEGHRKKKINEIALMVQNTKKLKIENKKYKYRLKKAMSLATNATFLKCIKKFTAMATIFTFMQFRESSKKKMGRRFTPDEKILSIALYKKSPKAYRWLRKIFVLPAPTTLSRMIRRADLRAGINENLFAQLKKKAKHMKPDDKLCILLFDEMSLTPHLEYNRRRDDIVGFVNDGHQTEKKIADHALVFMIRGVVRNYKQPIAYSFSYGTTSTMSLVRQLSHIIMKLNSIGFKVMSTVCDQGTTNVSAINYLIEKTKGEKARQGKELRHYVFEIDGKTIVPLFDPPHLIKGIRNNMLTKDLMFITNSKKKTAKWEHIVKLYEENAGFMGLRMLPKLSENHVYNQKIPKMKVKYATQIFSRTVATTMGYLAGKGILPKESEDTAEILLFFDELFDSMNGSLDNYMKRKGKPLLGPACSKKDSQHKSLWNKAKHVLTSMRFISKSGQVGSVPSIKNWLHTIENLEYIMTVLCEDHKVTSVWLRHFNQDPLENFFGCIRSHGGRNVSPTCAQFEAAFASLLVTNLSSNSQGSNCEEDTCKNFNSLKKIFFMEKQITSVPVNIQYEHTFENFIDFEEKIKHVTVRAQLQYVTGYFLRQLKKNVFKNCKKCNDELYTNENDALCYVKMRERISGKTCLSYPNPNLIKCFSNIQDTVINIINYDCTIKELKNYLKTILCIVINFNFMQCKEHKKENADLLQDLTCKFFINNFCRDTNKILNGKRTDFDCKNDIQIIAHSYSVNRRKVKEK